MTVVRTRRAFVALAVAGSALALAACNGGSGTAGSTTPPAVTHGSAIDPSKVSPPTPSVPTTWPLTGVAASDVAGRPGLAVKIENSVDARPQTGLEQADMVWEEVVEGGITRFAAVYQSQVPTEVGPIRSVRPMDPVIAGPLKGLIAFSGGQARFVAKVKASPLQMFSQDAGSPGFYRKKGVGPAPHNVYGTPSTWWEHADGAHSAPPARQFEFARSADQATAVVSGTPATRIAVTMSGGEHPSWTWDAASGTWQRSEGAKPAVARSGKRLAFTNVVTLSVRLIDTGTKDPAGNPVPETVLTGSGDGTLSSGGHTIAVRWTKDSDSQPVVLTTADGKPATLVPGTTWIELVPGGSGGVQAS